MNTQTRQLIDHIDQGFPRASLPFAGPARRRRPRIEAQSQVEAGADRGQQSQGPGPDAERGEWTTTERGRPEANVVGQALLLALVSRADFDQIIGSEHDTGIVGEAILTLTRHGYKPDQILRTLRSVRIRALDLGVARSSGRR